MRAVISSFSRDLSNRFSVYVKILDENDNMLYISQRSLLSFNIMEDNDSLKQSVLNEYQAYLDSLSPPEEPLEE
jgi:uncharacterized protein YlxP (DUF503 family)